MPIDHATHPPDLLDVLDSVVRRDGAPAGFSGTVCFGLRTATSVRWWRAEIGSTVRTFFSGEKPTTYDVAVGLDENGARRLMGESVRREALQMVAGDRRLLRRFARRYFGAKKSLQWRLMGAT